MLFEQSYKTIEANGEGVFKDRGSRFLAFAFSVKSEHAVKEIINGTRVLHSKANHHCYAFRLGPGKSVFRFSDDREPAGSAGKPIFGVIQSHDLTDVLIIVVRYFGGTLLGVPGLINAYRSAAVEAILHCTIIEKIVMEQYNLLFDYNRLSLVMEILKSAKATVISSELETKCSVSIELPKQAADILIGKIRHHYLLKDQCEIKVLR